MKKYNIAVVGATGMVGNMFLKVLSEMRLPVENYYLFASQKSAGKVIDFMEKPHVVIELTEESIKNKNIDIALFSAGGEVSKIFAPLFVNEGAVVIDNSSFWRMDERVPLVVPEVNPDDVKWHSGIIANPNCSTIQAMLPLKVLDDLYKIKRVVYSTYQAVSGAGVAGYNDLKDGLERSALPQKFPHPIANNVIPHIDVFTESGYTKEEIKMIEETRKILHHPHLKVTATTVRVPVFNGHSESINLEFEKPCDLQEMKNALASFPGITLVDDAANLKYPMPIYSDGSDQVFVGRVRLDPSLDSGCNLWVVADNIRKGAATNAVQIAKHMIENNLI